MVVSSCRPGHRIWTAWSRLGRSRSCIRWPPAARVSMRWASCSLPDSHAMDMAVPPKCLTRFRDDQSKPTGADWESGDHKFAI